jgi:hypothetical protein
MSLTQDDDGRFAPIIVVLLGGAAFHPILPLGVPAMLDTLGTLETSICLVAFELTQTGEDGEDLELPVFLEKTASSSTSAYLGLEVDEELDALELARTIESGKMGRAVSRGVVDGDGSQSTAVLSQLLLDLVFASECAYIPGQGKMVTPERVVGKEIGYSNGVLLGDGGAEGVDDLLCHSICISGFCAGSIELVREDVDGARLKTLKGRHGGLLDFDGTHFSVSSSRTSLLGWNDGRVQARSI